MESGALVAGFSLSLKWEIGGVLLGYIFIQHDSAEVVTRKKIIFVDYRHSTWMTLVKTKIVL